MSHAASYLSDQCQMHRSQSHCSSHQDTGPEKEKKAARMLIEGKDVSGEEQYHLQNLLHREHVWIMK